MAGQLIFDLPFAPASGRADFFVSPANRLAAERIGAPEGWPDGKLVLVGPAGSGKSHLAQIWAKRSGALIVPAAALAQIDPGTVPHHALVVEDADRAPGGPASETALFHLHNLVLAAGGRLLITARTAPARWPVGLADLASRMQATSTATLDTPDEPLLAAVLVKLFADRQVHVSPALIRYLTVRCERSLAVVHRLVAALDARALAEGRPISRALAAEVLDSAIQAAP